MAGMTDGKGSRMRVFLTGATGFIGSHVAEALVAGRHEVTCLVRPQSSRWRLSEVEGRLRYEVGDLESVRQLASGLRGHDAVIHLAAYGVSRGQSEYPHALATNVLGTANAVIAAAEASVGRLVLAGSCMEYGQPPGFRVQGSGFGEPLHPGKACAMDRVEPSTFDVRSLAGTPIGEDRPLWPCHVYGATKAAATVAAIGAARQLGVPLIVLRPFHVLGPKEEQSKFIPSLICRALDGKEVQMTRGEQIRDYCYVTDIAQAFVAALEIGFRNLEGCDTSCKGDGSPAVVNVGTGKGRPLAEIAAAVLRRVPEAGRLAATSLPYRTDEVWSLVADVSAARRLLGWQATTSVEEGICRTIQWYRRWRHRMPQAA